MAVSQTHASSSSVTAQTREILLQVIDSVPSHSDANMIGEGRVRLIDALKGQLEVKLEHPEYSGAQGDWGD